MVQWIGILGVTILQRRELPPSIKLRKPCDPTTSQLPRETVILETVFTDYAEQSLYQPISFDGDTAGDKTVRLFPTTVLYADDQ